ncbi:MAG TPA: FkbM family methyltransferase [Thermoleophilaceae bacterium]|jgi:FkbM family methyltransferase
MSDALARYTLPDGTSIASASTNEANYLYDEIFGGDCYAPRELRLPEAPTVLDLGANIGMFTLYAGRRWPGARLIAVEPIPEICRALEENCAAVGATAVEVAIGSRVTEKQLLFFPKMTLMSCEQDRLRGARSELARYLRNTHQGLADDGEDAVNELVDYVLSGSPRHVKVTTISDLMRRFELSHVDLVKIDVEGSELEALNGVADADWQRIGAIVSEVDEAEGALTEVVALLERAEFEVRTSQAAGYTGTGLHLVVALKRGWTTP